MDGHKNERLGADELGSVVSGFFPVKVKRFDCGVTLVQVGPTFSTYHGTA